MPVTAHSSPALFTTQPGYEPPICNGLEGIAHEPRPTPQMDANHQTYGDFGLRTASRPTPTERIAGTAETLILGDGTLLLIRPLECSDRDGLLGLFARLSPESRQRRFLAPKPQLSKRELDYLSDVDHVSHEALVAIDSRDAAIVGVARYAQVPGEDHVADVAVAVADDVHGMGIGTALTTRLVQRARSNRLDALRATTRWENRPARALMRRLGFRARASGGGELEYELALALRSECARCARH